MKTNLLMVEGFASGINDDIKGRDEKTISHYALPIVMKKLDIATWREVHSTRLTSRRRIREAVEKFDLSNNTMIICKSMGVVEVFDFLESDDSIDLCNQGLINKIAIVCIDGHSKLWKDIIRFRPPYGKRRSFNRADIPKTQKFWIKIYNVFQQEKWPEGAIFWGANYGYQIKDEGIDHFSIIRCKTTLGVIKNACDWINSKPIQH